MPAPDAFDILGLAPRFDLTPGEIQRAYLALAAAAHPDRGSDGGGEDGTSAKLNAAKQQVDDLEQRAALLLARLGGPSKEADRSLPNGFLMQMMEVRESVDAAQSSGDRAGVSKWLDWAEAARDGHLAAVGRAFAALSTPPTTPELAAVRRELNAWRYIERMLEQIEPV